MAWKGEANTRSVRQITLLPAQRLQYQALEDLGKDPVSFWCWSIGRSLTCFGRSEMKFAQLSIRPLLHGQYIVQWAD